MRATALALALLLSSAIASSSSVARADDPPPAGPTDGGVPADAATAPADLGPAPADFATPVAGKPPSPPPVSLVAAAPPPDAPAHARPTPLYRSPLFWTSVIVGAGAVAAIAAGIGLAATFHPRYALVTF